MIDQRTAPYAALLLRVIMGVFFIIHGSFKIFYLTLPSTAYLFNVIGIWSWLGYVVPLAEVIGGSALVVGFYARYVALFFIPELLGIVYFVHYSNGWLFTHKGGGWEYPAFWAVALVVQFLLGDGIWALKPSSRKSS